MLLLLLLLQLSLPSLPPRASRPLLFMSQSVAIKGPGGSRSPPHKRRRFLFRPGGLLFVPLRITDWPAWPAWPAEGAWVVVQVAASIKYEYLRSTDRARCNADLGLPASPP